MKIVCYSAREVEKRQACLTAITSMTLQEIMHSNKLVLIGETLFGGGSNLEKQNGAEH